MNKRIIIKSNEPVRPKCLVDGCNNVAKRMNNKSRIGKHPFHDLCNTHYRKKYKILSKCILCGWDKASCDRHRIREKIPKRRGYIKGNIIYLCPNCHRLVHRGFVIL